MTNFEWIKNNDLDNILMNFLMDNLAVCKDTGETTRCCCISCNSCLFFESTKCCSDLREEWLKQEHQPFYKKGDVVIDGEGKIYLVIFPVSHNTLMVTDNFNDFISNRDQGVFYMHVTKVKERISSYLYCDNDQ